MHFVLLLCGAQLAVGVPVAAPSTSLVAPDSAAVDATATAGVDNSTGVNFDCVTCRAVACKMHGVGCPTNLRRVVDREGLPREPGVTVHTLDAPAFLTYRRSELKEGDIEGAIDGWGSSL